MNEYRNVVDIIVKRDQGKGDMVEYKVIMEDLMSELEYQNHNLYEKTMKRLEDVAYDITHENAEKIVNHMKPFGEHWRYDEVKDYIEKKGIYKCYEKYYLVMNMAYNDYYDVAVNYGHQNDTEFFFEIAHAFINDEDAKPHKVSKYFSE